MCNIDDYQLDMVVFEMKQLLNIASNEEEATQLLAESSINISGEQINCLVDEYYNEGIIKI